MIAPHVLEAGKSETEEVHVARWAMFVGRPNTKQRGPLEHEAASLSTEVLLVVSRRALDAALWLAIAIEDALGFEGSAMQAVDARLIGDPNPGCLAPGIRR